MGGEAVPIVVGAGSEPQDFLPDDRAWGFAFPAAAIWAGSR